MKLSLTQENLLRAVGTVSKAVNSRNSLPVLSNILIATDKNRLKLASTNLELGITHWVGCKVEAEGSITVPARLLSELVSSMGGQETIDLSLAGTTLYLSTAHHKTHINGIDAEEFPLIPAKTGKPDLVLNSIELKQALAEVVVATSIDEARPVLAGVYMYTEGENLVVVATDSYRLAERIIRLGSKTSKRELAAIIPTRTVQELIRILSDQSGDVSVYMSDNQIVFEADSTELTSRLVEGKFPDYRKIIPESCDTEAEIDTSELSRLAKVSSLFARQNAGGITVRVNRGGHITLQATSADVGDNESSADCVVRGEDAEVSLNARYLVEALGIIDTPSVSFGISGKTSPCVVRPLAKGDTDYTYIIMPLRS